MDDGKQPSFRARMMMLWRDEMMLKAASTRMPLPVSGLLFPPLGRCVDVDGDPGCKLERW